MFRCKVAEFPLGNNTRNATSIQGVSVVAVATLGVNSDLRQCTKKSSYKHALCLAPFTSCRSSCVSAMLDIN